MHCAVVAEFLRLETCRQAELLSPASGLEQRSLAIKFLISVRDRALEVCRDARVIARLDRANRDLSPSEMNLLRGLSVSPP